MTPANSAAFSQTLHGSSNFVPGSAIGVPQPILPETICMFRDIDCNLCLHMASVCAFTREAVIMTNITLYISESIAQGTRFRGTNVYAYVRSLTDQVSTSRRAWWYATIQTEKMAVINDYRTLFLTVIWYQKSQKCNKTYKITRMSDHTCIVRSRR